jgi:hypothetical protein
MPTNLKTVIPMVAVAALGAFEHAWSRQDEPPAKTEPATAPQALEPPVSLLAGPSIAAESEPGKSLVERDFNGALVRLETRPEVAAVRLLTLDAEQQRSIDALISARTSGVRELTFDHLDLFLAVQSARQSGAIGPGAGGRPSTDIASKIRELRSLAAPLLDPPLVEQIAVALPLGQRDAYRAVVKEYADALIAEGAGERGMGEGAPRPRQTDSAFASQRLEFNQLLREMARSLSAVVAERREQFDALIATVNATPEQTMRIQTILRETAGQPGKPATLEERAATARKIMDVLTPEQRVLLRAARQQQSPSP